MYYFLVITISKLFSSYDCYIYCIFLFYFYLLIAVFLLSSKSSSAKIAIHKKVVGNTS